MANNWTKEQELAIYYDKKTNVIVSAGAGSGKTRVLTQRVIEKLKKNISINQLLILTFTNKAAFEMKDRIRKAIAKDESLIKELDFIDSSYITTFDSFALSMVKKYSYLLNIGSDVTIADSSTVYLEKKRILDDIFDRLYKEKNKDFLKLIGDFTTKKDDDIKKYIFDINDKLDLKYDKIDFLNKYFDNYYSDSNLNKEFDDYISLLKSKIKDFNLTLTEFSNYVDIDNFNKLMDAYSPLLESDSYESIKNNLTLDVPSMKGLTKEASDFRDKVINKARDELKELTKYENREEAIECLSLTKDYVRIIIEIIKELDERINSFKANLNVYEFNDIAKMAIKVVKENEEVRKELTNSFEEIMIDEYQDTSDIQEEFIKLIANNNVYVVGDIKQSIYRFRNANPYLFKNKYDSYSKGIDGFKIDLTKNFRSRDEVIEGINVLFSDIMTDYVGGADYKSTHKMVFGKEEYNNVGKNGYDNNIEIINYVKDKELDFSKEEIEIFYIAQDIKKKVESKYQVFDKDTEQLRDANYGDFAILLDKSYYFDLYKKIFEYFNIPMIKCKSTNITNEVEIQLFNNIIKLLINRRDKVYDIEFKYALTSILRSYLFNYDDQSIFDIITEEKYDLELLSIVDSIVKNIDSLSLKEIINEIIDKFDFYSKIISVGDIENRVNRITSIVEIFDNLASIGYTIDDAYNYLSKIIEDEYKIEVKESSDASNSVKIMTIHASKGLEFPVVYLASLHSEFNIRELNDKFMYYDKFGIVCPYFKDGIGKTFVKDLVRNDYMLEEISEKIRLFYVAITRTREKLIAVTSIPEKNIVDIKKSKCFLDFLVYAKDILNPYIKDMDINALNLTDKYDLIKKSNYVDSIEKCSDKLTFEEINIPNQELHKEKISKETHDLLDKETKDKMKFGTLMHEVLELIDFKNPDLDNIKIDDYFKDKVKNFISLIDVDKLVKVYKEYEFLYHKDSSTLHGIVDLILEYDDHIKIIDYKLKNVSDENYIKQLESYRDYISLKTNKKIDIYLFSIIDGTFNKLS